MLVLLCAAGCGGGHPHPRPAPGPSLSTGLTEYDPAVLAGPEGVTLRPRFARVVVLWSAVQPRPDAPPNWDARGAGGFGVRA